MINELIKNEKVSIEYRPDRKEIFMQDLTDHNNDPAEYNTTRRGIAKAWAELQTVFNGVMTMHDVSTFLEARGIRMHYWFMMD
jgi:hypothetical protein